MRTPCEECDGKPVMDLSPGGSARAVCVECDGVGYGPCPWCWERTCEDERCGEEERQQERDALADDHHRDEMKDRRAERESEEWQ